jgi:pantetheine-phosphate adenylyltransferase
VEGSEGKKGVTRRYGGTFVTVFDRSELTMIVAVCPGSFDPVTMGHLDIIRRAAKIFDHVVIAVGGNLSKAPRLSAVERARLIEKVTADIDNVSVEVMEGLLVNFAREQGAQVIVKGLRAVSDFESEFEQAQLNRTMFPELETVFIMASAEHSFLSSSAVREIASLDGEVRGLVPEGILETVRQIYSGSDGKIQGS